MAFLQMRCAWATKIQKNQKFHWPKHIALQINYFGGKLCRDVSITFSTVGHDGELAATSS